MEILYEDKHLIVCCKEAGLPVQSARLGMKDLESILKNYLWEKQQEKGNGKEPYLAVVHRLDQPVEGVLVFAKTPEAAKKLSAQLTDGRMKKTYLAVTHLSTHRILETAQGEEQQRGKMQEEKQPGEKQQEEKLPSGKQKRESQRGKIEDRTKLYYLEDYLVKDGRTNTSRIGRRGEPGAKLAKLEYEILGAEEDKALVKIHLYTGRHHQIRVQMAGAGMPLCGDRKYGSEEKWKLQDGLEGKKEKGRSADFGAGKDLETQKIFRREDSGNKQASLALCAAVLEFFHPGSGKKMRFACRPKGEYFQEFASILESQVSVQGGLPL